MKWKEARATVYGSIYDSQHLNAAMMVYRAVEIAFTEGKLMKGFFYLDDSQAIDYLLNNCGAAVHGLIERALRWQWYTEIFTFETENPSPNFEKLISDSNWKGRRLLADIICSKINIHPKDACVYIGAGKDRRKITVPFELDGKFHYDENGDKPIYRVRVYIEPNLVTYKDKIHDLILQEIN